MAEPTERTPMPPQKRAQATTDTDTQAEPEKTAEKRSAASRPAGAPVPIPGGADTALTVEQVEIRRRSPTLPAVRYDGSNAVQVGAWILAQNRAGCQVEFRPGKMPRLMSADGSPVERGWILPNLEVVSEQDLTTIYEVVTPA